MVRNVFCLVLVLLGFAALASSLQLFRSCPSQRSITSKRFSTRLRESINVEFDCAGGEKVMVSAKLGEPLGEVAERGGVTIPYQCRKGECGTCQVKTNGKWIKTCQTFVTPGLGGTMKLYVPDKEKRKKPSTFFTPASFLEGVVNNGVGVVGFIAEAVGGVDSEFTRRMEKEKALAEKVRREKEKKQGGFA